MPFFTMTLLNLAKLLEPLVYLCISSCDAWFLLVYSMEYDLLLPTSIYLQPNTYFDPSKQHNSLGIRDHKRNWVVGYNKFVGTGSVIKIEFWGYAKTWSVLGLSLLLCLTVTFASHLGVDTPWKFFKRRKENQLPSFYHPQHYHVIHKSYIDHQHILRYNHRSHYDAWWYLREIQIQLAGKWGLTTVRCKDWPEKPCFHYYVVQMICDTANYYQA